MKKAFILIVTVLTVVSLMGQSMKKKEHPLDALHQKSIKKVMELFSPMGLDKDYKKHPEFTKNNQNNKSVKEIKQVLDSMDNTADGIIYYRERYTYNAQGNCTLLEGFNLGAENMLVPSFRNEYSFNASGDMLSHTYMAWDADLIDWFIYFKIEYSYSNGLLINGNMFTWDADLSSWDLVIKEEFSYDAQNRLTTIVTLVDNNGTWEQEYKEEVSYNAAGYAYLWMDYDWNASTSSWIPDSKDEDFFDANGDVEMNLQSIWDEVSDWIERYKSEYTYDGNHQMLTDIYSEVNEMTMQWDILNKNEYSYDEHGNSTVTISNGWDGAAWFLSSKEELSFDYSVPNEEVVYPNEYSDFEYSHKLTEAKDYIWDGSWMDDEQYVFYYSEKDVSGIVDIINSKISIYPNPSTGIFNIEIDGFGQQFSISVLDFAGRVIEQEEVNASANEYTNTLDLSKYSSGVYFIKISNDSKSDYQKIVIQ